MAILNLYQNGGSTKNVNATNSPVAKSHYFSIQVVNSSLTDEEQSFNSSFKVTGILDNLPGISYQTSWEGAPVSVISENVKSFTDNSAIRTFAQNNDNYRMPIVTDGWTQQMPKDGCSLNLSLSFKAYPQAMFMASDYRSILNFLFFVTTPREYYLSDSAKYIGKALEHANAQGKKFGTLLDQTAKDFKRVGELSQDPKSNVSLVRLADYTMNPTEQNAQELNDSEQTLASELNEIKSFFDNLLNMSNDNVGGVPLCDLEISGLIKNNNLKVKWLVKSWSFKPCINTTRYNGLEMPMFVDFKIDLETQTILSNEDMIALFQTH